MLRLEARPEVSVFWSYMSPLLAVVLTLIAGFLLFSALTDAPLQALSTFFISPISDIYGISELLLKATPILLCAYGLAICYRASVWNIGAEGQLLIGALVGSAVALTFVDSTSSMAMPLTLLAGIVGGTLWAGFAAMLKVHFHTNEILTTIMMNYIALNLLLWSVHGPLKDPGGYNFPESALFGDSTLMPIIWADTRLHIGILFAAIVMGLTWVFLSRSFVGFQIQVLGLDQPAARMAGFKGKRLTYLVLMISGGLAGLAGAVEVAGPIGQLVPSVSPGYGYSAIIVAFLGRLHPVGITLSGLLMALIFMGGELAQIDLGLPNAITGVFQGLLLFFLLACDVFIRYRIIRAPKLLSTNSES
ncbi:MAG: ABC transporter permease [Psychromonas sp.]